MRRLLAALLAVIVAACGSSTDGPQLQPVVWSWTMASSRSAELRFLTVSVPNCQADQVSVTGPGLAVPLRLDHRGRVPRVHSEERRKVPEAVVTILAPEQVFPFFQALRVEDRPLMAGRAPEGRAVRPQDGRRRPSGCSSAWPQPLRRQTCE